MSDEPVIDAEVVNEEDVPPGGGYDFEQEPPADPRPEEPAQVDVTKPGADLELRPAGTQVLMPMDSEQVIAGMEAYQRLLHELLDPSDWQSTGGDRFPKKSAWRKIGRAFNLSTAIVQVTVQRDEEGNPITAEAIVRAIAPNGQVSDGDGYCSAKESRFASAKGRQKLENDMRATATTRAKNRAISDLVGMGEVSAEEAELGGGSAQLPEADKQLKGQLSAALTYLVGEEQARKLWGEIKRCFNGALPAAAAAAIVAVIRVHKQLAEPAAEPAPPAESQHPPEQADPPAPDDVQRHPAGDPGAETDEEREERHAAEAAERGAQQG